MPRKPEVVVVVGGGVVGCFIAYRLAIEDVAVTLVERDTPGAASNCPQSLQTCSRNYSSGVKSITSSLECDWPDSLPATGGEVGGTD